MSSTEASVQFINAELFDKVASRAAESRRLRMNHNFYAGASDNPHRFLNVLLTGTYVRPHRHLEPPKAETFLVLEGVAAVVLFDTAGNVTARHDLGNTSTAGHLWGIDIAPGVWHTILPISARAVCFEVKPGPWDPSTDKDFASWAPGEDDPDRDDYLNTLKQRIGLL